MKVIPYTRAPLCSRLNDAKITIIITIIIIRNEKINEMPN